MAYKEIKFKGPTVFKNQPKPPSKHIQTADLGTILPFLSDNLGTIITGGAGVISGLAGYAGYELGKLNRFRNQQRNLRNQANIRRWKDWN